MTPSLPAAFLTVPLAHRALHDVADGRPENSLAAIRAALAAGYGIEIDLQLSQDGCAMVFHDYHLDRLAEGTGPVRARTREELRAIPLKGGDGEGVPDLAEVLELVDGQVPLLIELKDQQGEMGVTDGALERATAEALKGYSGPVALMSFNPNSVAELAQQAPEIARGITTSAYDPSEWAELPKAVCDDLRGIPDFERSGSSFISHEAGDLARPRVQALRSAGVPVLCWTIRSAAEEAAARAFADNVTFERYLSPLTS
ncbi:glycerophosphodiester phosphodiesterase family protein [Leisingera sp. McT4-56]|uniref:glycerophosphodiester phosphodiesterase family protein n=1 Tax=Leisingera sp. McT4-56 TaxID=2881255 RepID=UPI001CF8893B|nr:glycerophosphodiester phosphodiesterase family protein [Leisingera sp. McT4-56]MCB4454922.1 phosphodiesterase [Leisingera sp. McT4-56]